MGKFYYENKDIGRLDAVLPKISCNEVYVVFGDNTVAIGEFIGVGSNGVFLFEVNGVTLSSWVSHYDYKSSKPIFGIFISHDAINLTMLDAYGVSKVIAYATIIRQVALSLTVRERYYMIHFQEQLPEALSFNACHFNVYWALTMTYQGVVQYSPDRFMRDFRSRKTDALRRLREAISKKVDALKKVEAESARISDGIRRSGDLIPGKEYFLVGSKTPKLFLKEYADYYQFRDKNGFMLPIKKNIDIFETKEGSVSFKEVKALSREIGVMRSEAEQAYKMMVCLMKTKPYMWRKDDCEVVDVSASAAASVVF